MYKHDSDEYLPQHPMLVQIREETELYNSLPESMKLSPVNFMDLEELSSASEHFSDEEMEFEPSEGDKCRKFFGFKLKSISKMDQKIVNAWVALYKAWPVSKVKKNPNGFLEAIKKVEKSTGCAQINRSVLQNAKLVRK